MTVDDLQRNETSAAGGPAPIRTWDVLAPLVLSVAILLGGLIAIGFLAAMVGFVDPFGQFLIEQALDELSGNFFVLEAMMAVFYLLLLFLVWRFHKRRGEIVLPRYAASGAGRLFPGALTGTALALAFLALSYALSFDAEVSPIELAATPATLAQFAFSLVGAGLLAAFIEEIYLRGLVLSWLRQHVAAVAAIAINGAVSALLHLQFLEHPGAEGWIVSLMIALLGAMNAAWVVRTGSLWPAIAAHITYNAILVTSAFAAAQP